MTMRAADDYVAGRARRHEITPTTATNLRHVLRKFAGECPDLDRINRRKVTRWMNQRADTVGAGTLRHEFSVVRTFLRWCVLEGQIAADPTIGLKGPKEPDYAPRALTGDEVRQLYRWCATERERVIVTLMVQIGVRCCEVSRLTMADVDLRAGVIDVRGKGGKVRHLPITEPLARDLRLYLDSSCLTAGPLFPSQWEPHRPISAGYVSEIVRRIFSTSGVKVRAYDGKAAHALRHTCASDMIDRGATITEVQQMLGHASISTTQRYLRRHDAARLRPAAEGRDYEQDVQQLAA